MAPAIVPGLGIAVLVGANVIVFVALGPKVGVREGVGVVVWVLVGCPMVGDVCCSRVGEDNGWKVCKGLGVGWADWVKTANVETTAVATAPELIPPGVAAPGRLQALMQEVKRTERRITDGFFIAEPPISYK